MVLPPADFGVSSRKDSPMKTFTLDEAQSLLPVLEALLKRAIDGKRAAEEAETELSELSRRIYLSGGMRVNLADVARQVHAHASGEVDAPAEFRQFGFRFFRGALAVNRPLQQGFQHRKQGLRFVEGEGLH